MMNMDSISQYFKAFSAAADCLNFTTAANKTGMTQSGVSQHIAKLEAHLQVPLFHRTGKKVVLTESGAHLRHFVEQHEENIGLLREKLLSETIGLSGRIKYAMPPTCLVSPHFSRFLQLKKSDFPEVELSVDIIDSKTIIDQVLNSKIHFAFTTTKIPNESLEYQFFCEEEYVLASASKNKILPKRMRLISYPDSENIMSSWLSNLDSSSSKSLSWNSSLDTNSLHAALTMVAEDSGVAILPKHCIEEPPYSKKIMSHPMGRKPTKNKIFIVKLKSASMPRRIQLAIDTFLKIKG